MTFYKYCKRCGKRLKGEENRLRGFGETCFRRVQSDAQKDLNPLVPPSNYPIEIITKQVEKGKNLQGRGTRTKQEESGKSQNKPRAKQIINTRQNQEDKASKDKDKSKHEAKAKSKQGRGQGASEKSSKEKSLSQREGAKPPHLEKTLSPTRKTGLLFKPHT